MRRFFKAREQGEQQPVLGDTSPPLTPVVAERSSAGPVVDRQAKGWVPRPEPEPAQEPGREPPDGVAQHLVSLVAPTSFEAEQYRALRHIVEQKHKAGGLSIVAVTSPTAGDGKTTTAINLAGALAQAPEARVLLVEADLRRPLVSVGGYLGVGDFGGLGLVDAILDPGLALEEVVRHHPRFNLSLLPAGWRPTAPYEALKSSRLGELLEQARQRYDYVVIDTAPLVLVPDARVIGKWVDGFLMVVAAHQTPRRLVEEALKVMDLAKIVGLVFNKDDRPLSGYYGYYYTYRQSRAGNRTGWWRRAAKTGGGPLRRRGSSDRPRGA